MSDGTKIEWAEAGLFGDLPRRCSKCREVKPLTEFQADSTRVDGRAYVCWCCRYPREAEAPGARERRQRRALGQAWCSGCKAWLALNAMTPTGLCRDHKRAAERARYAADEQFRIAYRARIHARRRRIAPLPTIARECLTELFDGLCAYCPAPATTWDHVKPVSKGGQTVPGNIVPACSSCNSSKRTQDVFAWLARRGRQPSLLFAEHTSMEWRLYG